LTAEALLEAGYTKEPLAIIDAVLAADPQNIMANHLCLHYYDNVADRSPGLPCAQRLDAMNFPPEAEHLAHMPAHYWIETGNYAAAEASSERALGLFAQLEANTDRDPEHDRYLRHDTYVGYSAAMMLGNYADAQRWATRMNAAYATTSYRALAALRFGRFQDAFEIATGKSQMELAIRGYAALILGQAAQASAIAANLRKMSAAGYMPELFFARLAEVDGNNAQANRWIDSVVDEQNRVFGAELIPLLPALEARAGLLLRAHDNAKAIAAFNAALAAYPNDPRALFGLASALDALGRTQDAATARARLAAVWQNADTALGIDLLL
jgi:tetratricopeptide (TPR) repeat protein